MGFSQFLLESVAAEANGIPSIAPQPLPVVTLQSPSGVTSASAVPVAPPAPSPDISVNPDEAFEQSTKINQIAPQENQDLTNLKVSNPITGN